MHEHNSDFTHDLKAGVEGEKIIAGMLKGDMVEVKSEFDIWKITGNTFVEVYCRGKRSGIAATHAKWWTVNLILKGELIVALTVETKRLKEMIKKNKYKRTVGGDNNLSKGFLVPIRDLIQE